MISVIVPSYNGAGKIAGILDTLSTQVYKDFEVIIVLDGSTDNSQDVIRVTECTCAIHVLDQVNKGRAVARNSGVLKAQGDLLVFFDDDMLPKPDCLQIHYEHHQKYKNTILVGPALSVAEPGQPDFSIFKSNMENGWTPKFPDGFGQFSKQNLMVTAANMSMPRRLFDAIGGFDSRLRDREDIELGHTAIEMGIDIYYSHHAFAWHNDIFSCRQFILRRREYIRALKTALELKPDDARLKAQIHKPGFLKRLIFSLFSLPFLVSLIDKDFFVPWMPRSMRYSLYHLVSFGLGLYYPSRKL